MNEATTTLTRAATQASPVVNDAQAAFADPHRVIAKDLAHGEAEKRFYGIGKVSGGILTVRFTYRRKVMRIIRAGYWRKGKAIYEKEDRLHG